MKIKITNANIMKSQISDVCYCDFVMLFEWPNVDHVIDRST